MTSCAAPLQPRKSIVERHEIMVLLNAATANTHYAILMVAIYGGLLRWE